MLKKVTKMDVVNSSLKCLKKVAAYTRVSDGKEAMLHSLSAQISYYSDYIQKHLDWEYAGVYVDKALTGTKDNRPEFQKMIRDCEDGKIDVIITKSISRFARNTVTALETLRKLKNIDVDVYFEEENIHSLSADGELMITLLASYAQEESRSVSENCKWRLRNKFKEGLPNNFKIYGYELKNNRLEVIPHEAKIIKMIFEDYLSEMGRNAIIRKLNELKIKPKFADAWRESVVFKILQNEKYIGDMLLQKSFVSDHLSKKQVKNNGQLPQYYVSDCHEAIIDRATFEKVQSEIKRRSTKSKKSKKNHVFTGKMKCGICGSFYKHKTTASGTKYEKSVWICNTFNSLGKSRCSSKQIPEDILKEKTAEVLQIPKFDKKTFKEKIKTIEISDSRSLTFFMEDGSKIHKTWENKSRRESWNEENRQMARTKALERVKKECKP